MLHGVCGSLTGMSHTSRIVLLVVALILSGCASVPKAVAPPDPAKARWFDGHTGNAASLSEAVSGAAGADAIIIGENHGHPLGLATAAAFFSDLLGHAPTSALALEFFERDEQSRVDEYLAGLTDEKKFKARTNRTASSYPQGHRDMVEAAKAAHRPVIAANAPRPFVSAAGKGKEYDNLRALPASLRKLIRIPDELPTGRYRDDFNKVMSDPNAAHGPAPKTEEEKQARLDSAFRGQSLWDWTMADSIHQSIAMANTPTCLVVGRFHEDFRGGLVQALEKLHPGVKIKTISFVSEWSDALKAEDKDRADFVVYVGPEADDKK